MRFSFLFFILICSFSFSQSKDIIIDWDGNKVFSTSSAKFKVPYFSNYNFNFTPSKGISLVAQWIDNSGIDKNSIVVENLQLSDISLDELMDLDIKTIPDKLNYNIRESVARGKTYLFIELTPIINQNGSYKKISN